jgi:acyl-CoA synthetase (AMP-forming)/AMP-acid ligase II
MDLKLVAPLPASPVPTTFLDHAQTLTGALETLAERFPDFVCLTILDRNHKEERLSLGALWSRARATQTALLAAGLGPQQFVILALPTGPEVLAAYFGVMLAGGVPGLVATPSNRVADPRAYAARIGAILRNADARLLYCDEDIAAMVQPHGCEFLGSAAVLTPASVSATPVAEEIARPSADAIATVQYSSGSTGTPKGILLTHRAMLNNIRAVRDGLGITPEDVSVNWIPLYHDMGLIDAFLLPVLSGCPTVLIPTMDFMRTPSLWLWALHHYRGALSWAPNFAYTICARRIADSEINGLDLSSWRIAINAAEPVLASTITAFSSRFARSGFRPSAMTPAWGLAENVTIATAHPVTSEPVIEHIDRSTLANAQVATPAATGLASIAIGRCLPHCEIQIRDADGCPLADRRVGTVWLRTNSLFARYHGNPELTAQVLVDGWLNTGDRGYLADGSLYFVSREKDLIVVGGEKYAPHDVETIINGVPGVREGCTVVFGVLSEERGTEDLAAVVETKVSDEGELNRLREAIRAAVTRNTGLALRYVILVPPGGIEKTTSGKLARRATRSRYADQFVD